RGEREGELVFLGEFLDRWHGVARDADHVEADLAELRQRLLEGTRLLGAAGRVGLGIEIQHERLAAHGGETDGAPAARRHLEIWCLVALCRAHVPISPTWRMNAARTSRAVRSMVALSAARSTAPVASSKARAEASGKFSGALRPAVMRSIPWTVRHR